MDDSTFLQYWFFKNSGESQQLIPAISGDPAQMTKSGDAREYPKIDLPETILAHHILSNDHILKDTHSTTKNLKLKKK